MKFFVAFVLSALAAIQVCSSASVEDAEFQLKLLRDETNRRIDEAFRNHSRMSNEVDEVAVKTKHRGLEEIEKKTDKVQAKLKADQAITHRCRGSRDHIYSHLKQLHSDELIKCVDQQGSGSVNVLSKQRMDLVEYVWNAIYEEEKHIIVCGRKPHCLQAAIADIKDKMDQVLHVIEDEVTISNHNKEVQIQAIKACGSRSIANVEFALSKIPTCSY